MIIMMSERITCEFSELDDDQGYNHCNRLVTTTVHRGDRQKNVCEQHGSELTNGEHVFNWEYEHE